MGELVSRLVKFVAGPPRGHVGWRFRNLAAAEAARKAALLSALVVSSLRPIFGPPGAYFGLSWGPFWAPILDLLAPLGPLVDPGLLLGRSWALLGSPWRPPGPLLAALGPLWAALGLLWGRPSGFLGLLWGVLGGSWPPKASFHENL